MASWADELDIDDSDILGPLNNKRSYSSQLASPPWPPAAGLAPSQTPLVSPSGPNLSNASSSAGVLKRFQKPRPTQNAPQDLRRFSLDTARKRKQSLDLRPPPFSTSICRTSPSLEHRACRRETSSQLDRFCEGVPNHEPEGSFLEEHCQSLSSHGFSPSLAGRSNSNLSKIVATNREEEMMLPSNDVNPKTRLGLSGMQQLNAGVNNSQRKEASISQLKEASQRRASERIAGPPQQSQAQDDMDMDLPTTGDRPLRMHLPSVPAQRSIHFHPANSGRRGNAERSEHPGSMFLIKELAYQIAGPAGSVQRGLAHKPGLSSRDNSGVKDNQARHQVSALEDTDFQSGAWISARNYLNELSISVSTICSVKACRTDNRISKLLCVIKSCHPNGCGDVMVNLKDRSDTINGTVNRRVMFETEFGRCIEPGAVILLHQVAVFSPTPYAHYLNITVNNVEQVFAKGVQFSKGDCSRAPTKTQLREVQDNQMVVDDDEECEILRAHVRSKAQVPNDVVTLPSLKEGLLPGPSNINHNTKKLREEVCLDRGKDCYDHLLEDMDLFPCLQPSFALV